MDDAAEIQILGNVLAVDENDLADELDRFRNAAKPGTCEWITKKAWFNNWLQPRIDGQQILWISGPPAAGKSVLAATTVTKIQHLLGKDSCQYHNLNFADRNKRSASYLLRSLAYQIAHDKPLFRRKLLQHSEQSRASFRHMNANIFWEKVFLGLLFRLMPERSLHWIIDGLDESDSIPTIFQCLNRIQSESLGLKILLVSRPTADISMHVKSFQASKLYIHYMTYQDTEDDIRVYVSEVVQSIIPGSDSVRKDIVGKILSKASGNFSWVSLILKALENNWYSVPDIHQVITNFPIGMSPLYDRMMQKLDQQDPKHQKLACLILTWATFSYRPLSLSEFHIALEADFPRMTSLEDIIRHVCVGFVQVHGTKIVLFHETAKHFLIHESTNNKIQITPSKGHEKLAITCLQYLSSSKERQWRVILKKLQDDQGPSCSNFGGNPSVFNQKFPFLVYAAQSWAYHVREARMEGPILDLLTEFLSKDALTWINTIALLGDLSTLTRSAQWLKTFVKRRKHLLEDSKSVQIDQDDLNDLNAWVKDLSRIVGKFGSILSTNPSSIYKLVPPFCPDSSMVKRYYGKTQNSFSVTGLSNPDWDDCHARRSVDPDDSGSQVLATTDLFVALVPSAQRIIIWNAETCEELRRISHEEYLLRMAINRKGDLICTSGLRTIKVWDIATGILLAVIPVTCDTHVIALAFGSENDEILSGYQDHTVICYDWRTRNKVFEFRARSEGEFFGGLQHMKFSPDGTQVVFGSKGIPIELWDLHRQERAYRYLTEQDAARGDNENLVFPEAIDWHPDGGRVYLLYHNLRLVDWNPVFEEQREYQISAKNMVCSPCGNYLLTSDSRGTVKVFALPDYVSDGHQRLRLIYHLEYDGPVRDLAFHPDGQRFYDLRGTACNLWQPEALVQADESGTDDDGNSNVGSLISSGPAEAFQEDCCQITTVEGGPQDCGYCCGRDDGTLSIHDIKTGRRLRALPGHAADAAIIAVVWSWAGNWIAAADDSGRVSIRQVKIPTHRNTKYVIWKALDFQVADGVLQLLISPNEKYLFVSSSTSVILFDIKRRAICQSEALASQREAKWVQDPTNPDRLLRICSDRAQAFKWDNLDLSRPLKDLVFVRRKSSNASNLHLALSDVSIGSAERSFGQTVDSMHQPAKEVTCTIQSRGFQSIIFETAPSYAQGQHQAGMRRVDIFRPSALDTYHQTRDKGDKDSDNQTSNLNVDLEDLPIISASLSRVVGVYQNQVVYFDHQHWLCSWEIGTSTLTPRKHLALPQDWLNDETLRLTTLTPSGTLLCPRNGEVAIIRGGIKL